MAKHTTEELLEMGFYQKSYEGQEGLFLRADLIAEELSDVFTTELRNNIIEPTDEVVVEFTPEGSRAQVYVVTSDHLIGPLNTDTEEWEELFEAVVKALNDRQ